MGLSAAVGASAPKPKSGVSHSIFGDMEQIQQNTPQETKKVNSRDYNCSFRMRLSVSNLYSFIVELTGCLRIREVIRLSVSSSHVERGKRAHL